MTLLVQNGTCGYSAARPILQNINFSVEPGEVLCILGPNGAGKSTLFKSMLRLIPMLGGALMIDGEDTRNWPRSKLAKTIGYIPQATSPAFAYSVADIILMGRTAYLGMFASPRQEDIAIAEAVVDELNISKLLDKRYTELSGGEKQLVLIARALVQQPQILVMDEPTAALDFGNQQLVLQQISLLSQQGLGIIMASHFPDHAFLYSHKALLLKDGSIYSIGNPGDVITEESLCDLYSVSTRIINTGVYSKTANAEVKVCVPLS